MIYITWNFQTETNKTAYRAMWKDGYLIDVYSGQKWEFPMEKLMPALKNVDNSINVVVVNG